MSYDPDVLNFAFSRAALDELARRHEGEFTSAAPFQHVVVHDFLPKKVAEALAAEFPKWNEPDWYLEGPGGSRHSGDREVEKLSCSDESFFPPLTRRIMHEFNSGTFLAFVEKVTGFKSLIPDPSFGGCGLHSTGRGGRLMIHADASRHPNKKLHQIINLIYYVTPEWRPEWGGSLELWDFNTRSMVKAVNPQFNSMLMFYTGPKNLHGHPHPVQSPQGVRRNSLAVYYYTTDREKGEDYDGLQREVKWVPTNALDNNVSMKRKVYRAVTGMLPNKMVDAAERQVRRLVQK